MIPDNVVSHGISIDDRGNFLEEDERLKRRKEHKLYKKIVDKTKKRTKKQTPSEQQQLKRQNLDSATPDRAARSAELEIEHVVQPRPTIEVAKASTSNGEDVETNHNACEGNNENT
ncbi:uncharacterized protein BDZ99DRAFT_269754 [Mytilinidion resinicola]|uniref:Uncharacterized protein n=1 Tax=Mytilinidion resinicola TaxID=574789 RepID=A0A6A6YUH4_9PEZI|nr:uncharacterized protein BDZ99DRAFT_269754 [Mytilinidion resinicola]KAF2812582.1 hypothetical protein BDZ99DRAFT_269754 [Mytilinidion resinicola]